MTRTIAVWLLLMLLWLGAVAQSPGLGTWNLFNVQYKHSKRWGLFFEAQMRSVNTYNNFFYYEYKGGLVYTIHPQLRLSLAVGDYDTYQADGNFRNPKANDELRIWPQLLLQQPLGRLRIEQRARTEMRFNEDGYRNRFRYRVGLSYPFGKEKPGDQAYRVAVSNEIFFSENAPYFERSRFLATVNRVVSREISVQLGYVYQYDYRLTSQLSRDFLFVGFFLSLARPLK
jgi:hypothetical protein